MVLDSSPNNNDHTWKQKRLWDTILFLNASNSYIILVSPSFPLSLRALLNIALQLKKKQCSRWKLFFMPSLKTPIFMPWSSPTNLFLSLDKPLLPSLHTTYLIYIFILNINYINNIYTIYFMPSTPSTNLFLPLDKHLVCIYTHIHNLFKYYLK